MTYYQSQEQIVNKLEIKASVCFENFTVCTVECHHPIVSEISYKGLLPLVQQNAWEILKFHCPIWAVKTLAKIAALFNQFTQ